MQIEKRHAAYFRSLAAIKTPRLISLVAVMMVGATLAAAAFLAFAPWVQTAGGSGVVTSLNPGDRPQEINALVSGRIAEWHVRDGSRVAAGDPIIRIIDNDIMLIDRLKAERAQAEARLAATQSALETSEIDLKRTEALFKDGLASRRDYELAKIKVDDFLAKKAEAAAAVNRAEVSLSRQSAQLVAAPRDGFILKINAGDVSTFIEAGEPIATFVPENAPLAVELFVNGRDVALIAPGDLARIEFEGWPTIQFSGWPSVAVGTFPAKVLSVDPSASESGLFRVLLVPDESGPPWPDRRFLRLGASARGWVLLKTVPLGYEIWRRLNDFPPEFRGAADSRQSTESSR